MKGNWWWRFETGQVLQEAQASYINRSFVGTVLLATSLVEHVLTKMLVSNKTLQEDKRSPNLEKIIDMAAAAHLIDAKLQKKAHELREVRNPFTHLRSLTAPTADYALPRRVRSADKGIGEVLQEDAEHALTVMFAVLDCYMRPAKPG